MKSLFVLVIVSFFVYGCSVKNLPHVENKPASVALPLPSEVPSEVQTPNHQAELLSRVLPATENKHSEVCVALLLPLNGSYAQISEAIIESIQLALNSEEYKNVVIRVFDTNQNNTNTAFQAAKQAVNNKVDVILGPLLTASLKQVIVATDDTNIPIFSFSNNRMAIGDKKNIYLAGSLPLVGIERVVDYISKAKGAKKFAILAPNNMYGATIYSDFKGALEARGLKLTTLVLYPEDTINFQDYIKLLVSPKNWMTYISELKDYNNKNETKYSSLSANSKDRPAPKLDFDALLIADYGKNLSLMAAYFPSIDIDITSFNVMGVDAWGDTDSTYTNDFHYAIYPSLLNFRETVFFSKFSNIYGYSPSLLDVIAYDLFTTINDLITINNNTVETHFDPVSISKYQGNGVLGSFFIRDDGIVVRDMNILQVTTKGANILDNGNTTDNFVAVKDYSSYPIKPFDPDILEQEMESINVDYGVSPSAENMNDDDLPKIVNGSDVLPALNNNSAIINNDVAVNDDTSGNVPSQGTASNNGIDNLSNKN